MKRWCGLIVLFLGTSLLLGYVPPEDRQYVDYFLKLQAADLFRTKSFTLESSWAFVSTNQLERVDMTFSCYRVLSINKARKLLVSVVKELLAKINSDTLLKERKLLTKPFVADKLYIEIKTDNAFSKNAATESIRRMYLNDGMITYQSSSASTLFCGPAYTYSESYEMALMLLDEPVEFGSARDAAKLPSELKKEPAELKAEETKPSKAEERALPALTREIEAPEGMVPSGEAPKSSTSTIDQTNALEKERPSMKKDFPEKNDLLGMICGAFSNEEPEKTSVASHRKVEKPAGIISSKERIQEARKAATVKEEKSPKAVWQEAELRDALPSETPSEPVLKDKVDVDESSVSEKGLSSDETTAPQIPEEQKEAPKVEEPKPVERAVPQDTVEQKVAQEKEPEKTKDENAQEPSLGARIKAWFQRAPRERVEPLAPQIEPEKKEESSLLQEAMVPQQVLLDEKDQVVTGEENKSLEVKQEEVGLDVEKKDLSQSVSPVEEQKGDEVRSWWRVAPRRRDAPAKTEMVSPSEESEEKSLLYVDEIDPNQPAIPEEDLKVEEQSLSRWRVAPREREIALPAPVIEEAPKPEEVKVEEQKVSEPASRAGFSWKVAPRGEKREVVTPEPEAEVKIEEESASLWRVAPREREIALPAPVIEEAPKPEEVKVEEQKVSEPASRAGFSWKVAPRGEKREVVTPEPEAEVKIEEKSSSLWRVAPREREIALPAPVIEEAPKPEEIKVEEQKVSEPASRAGFSWKVAPRGEKREVVTPEPEAEVKIEEESASLWRVAPREREIALPAPVIEEAPKPEEIKVEEPKASEPASRAGFSWKVAPRGEKREVVTPEPEAEVKIEEKSSSLWRVAPQEREIALPAPVIEETLQPEEVKVEEQKVSEPASRAGFSWKVAPRGEKREVVTPEPEAEVKIEEKSSSLWRVAPQEREIALPAPVIEEAPKPEEIKVEEPKASEPASRAWFSWKVASRGEKREVVTPEPEAEVKIEEESASLWRVAPREREIALPAPVIEEAPKLEEIKVEESKASEPASRAWFSWKAASRGEKHEVVTPEPEAEVKIEEKSSSLWRVAPREREIALPAPVIEEAPKPEEIKVEEPKASEPASRAWFSWKVASSGEKHEVVTPEPEAEVKIEEKSSSLWRVAPREREIALPAPVIEETLQPEEVKVEEQKVSEPASRAGFSWKVAPRQRDVGQIEVTPQVNTDREENSSPKEKENAGLLFQDRISSNESKEITTEEKPSQETTKQTDEEEGIGTKAVSSLRNLWGTVTGTSSLSDEDEDFEDDADDLDVEQGDGGRP